MIKTRRPHWFLLTRLWSRGILVFAVTTSGGLLQLRWPSECPIADGDRLRSDLGTSVICNSVHIYVYKRGKY
jgi:hypothetical protein